jgi:hypothetical protein
MARIFLSHSSQNNAAAIALHDWIIKGGWDDRPFLDLDPQRGIAAGERWERALHEEASRCEAVLFLVSRAWLSSEWCLKEFHLALKLNKRLFGVLIDDLPLSDLPPPLTTTWQTVNLASGADHELFRTCLPDLSQEAHVTFSRMGLARLKAGLDKAGLDPRFFIWPPEKEPDRSPYPGLRPLEAEDAGIFFGRDASMVVILDRLRGLREAAPPRLLAILGASGAGKSSFLRAGLIPRLARDDTNFLPLPIIRPETAVITGVTGLIHSIQAAFHACGHPCNRADITHAINGGACQLLPLLNRLAEHVRAPEMSGTPAAALPSLVVAIDQGEELFLAEGAKEAQDFLMLLKELTLASAPNLIALLTIRSDSYERLQTAKALEGVRQEIFALPPMLRGAYQTIIEGPALRLQDSKRPLKIEPPLIQALLTDIETGSGKDALPLLAFTLERLYREYGADGDLLAMEYNALGGIKGSIQAAVDAALKAADADPTIPKDSSERLVLLRNAFIPALAGIDRETHEARRRVARRSEIPEKARGLIKCLVDVHLLTTDTPPGASEPIIEPSHETLLRQWDALQGWLQEDAGALLMLDGIQQAAHDWDDHDRASDWLGHSAGRLEDAERLREREDFARFLGPVEQDYIQACRDQENERRDRELAEARKVLFATDAISRIAASTAGETFRLLASAISSLKNVSRRNDLWEVSQAEVYLDISRSYLAVSNQTAARTALDEGQEVLNRLAPGRESDPRIRVLRATAEELSGDIDWGTGKKPRNSYQTALQIIEPLGDDDVAKIRGRILRKLANLALKQNLAREQDLEPEDQGRTQDRLAEAENRLSGAQLAVARTHDLEEQAAVRESLAELARQRGHIADAVSLQDEAAMMFAQAVKAEPENVLLVLNRAVSLQRLGDLQSQVDPAKAVHTYSSSLAIIESISDAVPNSFLALSVADLARHGLRLLAERGFQASDASRRAALDTALDNEFARGIGRFQFGLAPADIGRLLGMAIKSADDLVHSGEHGARNVRYVWKSLRELDRAEFRAFHGDVPCLVECGYALFLFNQDKLFTISVRFVGDMKGRRIPCSERKDVLQRFASHLDVVPSGSASERRFHRETTWVAIRGTMVVQEFPDNHDDNTLVMIDLMQR